MEQSTKISYVTLVRLPTGRAHGYAIMKMCEQFVAQGAEVELVVPTRHFNPVIIKEEDPFKYYGIEKSFSLRKLWATDLLGRTEKSRIAFLIDELSFFFSVLTQKFDSVVYTRDYQVALFVRAKKIVLEIHDIPKRTSLFLRATHRVHKIVVISNGLKSALVALGVGPEKIVLAPDAVDLSEFAITPSRDVWKKYGVDPDKKIVLYTGHFYGWKGAETLAGAAQHMPPDTEVILMGGVDYELATFKEKYASNRVHMIGYQPREQLPQFLMTADVLILPNSAKQTISSHYTSPLKLFQYMAAGVPIVSSNLPSIREILTDDMAFWFTPDDEQSLRARIEYVLSHPEEARAKAARAREAVKKFTWDARARDILQAII